MVLPTTRILDGSMFSELQRCGFEDLDSDPLWSSRCLVEHPGIVKAVHKKCVLFASIDIFQRELGISVEDATNLIKSAVHLAKEAVSDTCGNVQVAGSVGPYGACLHDLSEYSGSYLSFLAEREISEWHFPRIKALVEGGVDMIAVETIPSLKEADIILNLIHDQFRSAKVYLTYSCKNSSQTCHGESISDAVKLALTNDQVVGVGVNCTAPDHISGLLKHLSPLNIDKEVIVKPNGGHFDDSVSCEPRSSVDWSRYVKAWQTQGASWFGGCCGVTAENIELMAHELNCSRDV